MKKFLVVLDPGHGGHDPGAVNRAHQLEEADMALDVCQRAKAILQKHPQIDARLTRYSDTFLSLSARAAIANTADADAFVSYHFNSAQNPNVPLSFEGFTTPGQNNSDLLADCILKRHGKIFAEQKIRADRSDGDLDKEASFAVLRATKCPSFLMEGEFIHTDHGAKLIGNPNNRQKMAYALHLGILDFFGLQPANEVKPKPAHYDVAKFLEIRKHIEALQNLTAPSKS